MLMDKRKMFHSAGDLGEGRENYDTLGQQPVKIRPHNPTLQSATTKRGRC